MDQTLDMSAAFSIAERQGPGGPVALSCRVFVAELGMKVANDQVKVKVPYHQDALCKKMQREEKLPVPFLVGPIE